MQPITFSGNWIWSSTPLPERNAFLRFRRSFNYQGGSAVLHLTADSRYTLFLNGRYLGFGPVRTWPNHSRYDSYDLTPDLLPGENVLAVLVNHYGEGTFQYLHGPEGLLAQLELDGQTIVSDEKWLVSPDPANIVIAPRISVQESFEEQYDARLADGWIEPGYDDSTWSAAANLRAALAGPHQNFAPRGIPLLTRETVSAHRVVAKEVVRSLPHHFTIYAKPYFLAEDFSSNRMSHHAYLATRVWAPEACAVGFITPHKSPVGIKVNGVEARFRPTDATMNFEEFQGAQTKAESSTDDVTLNAGWNDVLISLRQDIHLQEFTVCVDGPGELKFRAEGEGGSDTQWAIVGPFELGPEQAHHVANSMDESHLASKPVCGSATLERGEEIWDSGKVAGLINGPFYQLVKPEHCPPEDVFARSFTDTVTGTAASVENEIGLLSGSEWTTINPSAEGDVRLLLDWGKELVGMHRFEIVAAAGTMVDVHNFEFIQPDGLINLADGMNNSFRYICRDGFQKFETLQRRGFTYSYITLRNQTGPVQLRAVEAVLSTYPQTQRGSFTSPDAKLNRIWEVGAHTLRLCAEDTYTDCPTYEQTHWVGDARNEALVDWVVNGDSRLWYRCLEQAAHSLERSPLVESHVPSAWQNVLPAWSFLWMRSIREFWMFTGDREKTRYLLDYLKLNVEGVKAHLNEQGLFSIRAWNMFDWAAMDTPPRGVVTHNNCFAVHALRDGAILATEFGLDDWATEFSELADSLTIAINQHLWNDEQQAFTDCLREGVQSAIFSQQTQTVAVMSGVAAAHSAGRADRCRELIHHPPAGFVKAGSPFFEFFLLEAYAAEGREQEFLDTIRDDWGFMIDMGATVFWEMWSGRSGRLTRSHCHGWSSAPSFFLSTYVLGVRPGGPGFETVIIEPHPGGLEWCRGTVPTPAGDVEVQWENKPNQDFVLRLKAPEALKLEIKLPRAGKTTLNGVTI